MPQGLQTFDASGNTLIDTTTRLGRIHGVISKVGASPAGSLVVNSFDQGTPFYLVIQEPADYNYSQVSVSISGNTITYGASVSGYNLYYGTY